MTAETTSTRIGHALARFLGIRLNYRTPQGADDLSRGESVYSVSSADTFLECEPTSWDYIQAITPNGRDIARWAYNLFPFTHWITHYNVPWLVGDLIAGK